MTSDDWCGRGLGGGLVGRGSGWGLVESFKRRRDRIEGARFECGEADAVSVHVEPRGRGQSKTLNNNGWS